MPLGLPFFLDPHICVSLLVRGTTRDCSTIHLLGREALCEGILARLEVARDHLGGILARKAKQEGQGGPKVSAMEFVCSCGVESCPTQKSLTTPTKGDPMIPHQSGRKNLTCQPRGSVFFSPRSVPSNTVPIDVPSVDGCLLSLSSSAAAFV